MTPDQAVYLILGFGLGVVETVLFRQLFLKKDSPGEKPHAESKNL